MESILWKHIQSLRTASPLVHNITNFVVMNNSANALLAVGAAPIMAHSHSEVEEMVRICHSLVVNIGTLDEYLVEAMLLSTHKANEIKKPWILDPVGAGASSYRNEVLTQLLQNSPTVVRGNASEILSLAKTSGTITKGVDSTAKSDEAIDAANYIHERYGSIVCISGETDIIVDSENSIFITNGNELMTKVTGLGCSATAVIGAFIGVIENKTEAVCAAMALFSICGELAARQSNGPGSLQSNLLDKLYNISQEEFTDALKIRSDV